MVGISLPNKPYRKEIMATERLKPMFDAMVISFKDGIYFSQQKEGQIVGGIPIPEEISGYYTAPTVTFLEHMSKTLTSYAPCLKHVNLLRHWTGFYDVTPDARPILGEVEKLNGFIQCNGFSGHGFMLCPMVARILTNYMADNKSTQILEKLNLERFKVKELKDFVKRIADKNKTTVLLTGESGTGKTLIAKAIHNFSSYSDTPFIEVNCATIPETLVESELF